MTEESLPMEYSMTGFSNSAATSRKMWMLSASSVWRWLSLGAAACLHRFDFQACQSCSFSLRACVQIKKPLARGWQRLWYSSELCESLVGRTYLSAKKTHTRFCTMTMNNTCHSNNSQRDDEQSALPLILLPGWPFVKRRRAPGGNRTPFTYKDVNRSLRYS